MFDDPKEALRKLNEELLAAEEEEENLSEGTEEIDEDLPIRPKKETHTRAEGFGRMVYSDEVFDENAAVVPGEGEGKKKRKDKKNKKDKKGKRRGLPFFLWILVILALIGWWPK